METWLQDLVNEVNEIVYAQWAALGANFTVRPTEKALVDPDALMVATSAFGRYNARIFDEALDWAISNYKLLMPWRLKRLAKAFGTDVRRTLGAMLDFLANERGQNLFPGVISDCRAVLDEVPLEPLFWSEARLFQSPRRERHKRFLEWKLMRGTPRLREHSGAPDLTNPANLMTKLRRQYGTGAKSDTLAYLLTAGRSNGNRIARKIHYNQSSVCIALNELEAADMVEWGGTEGNKRYWVEEQNLAGFLKLRSLPVFIDWGTVLAEMNAVADRLRKNEKSHGGGFLEKEWCRDTLVRMVPTIRAAGEPLAQTPMPDIRDVDHLQENLRRFIEHVLRVLKRYNA